MHFNRITKGILPLIFIVGLFKITDVEAAGNQKVSGDNSKQSDYDYDEDVSNVEDLAPKATVKPYFESNLHTVYATKDVENITLECMPKNYDASLHSILWYNDEHPITTGNVSLLPDKYSVDNKYRLTILNFSKQTTGNFSCAVLPGDVRQYMAIEFGAPPENITDQTGGANTVFVEMALMFVALLSVVSLNYGHKF